MIIADSHNDYLIESNSTSQNIEKYLLLLKQTNVKLINFAFFTTHTSNFNLKTCLNKKNITLKIIKQKNINIKTFFSIEDMGFFDIKNLDDLIKLSPICCSLTWNNHNKYAGGAKTHYGITNKGYDLIKLLQKNNIIIDVAHLSKKAFYDFSKINNSPILNTHSGFTQIKNHFRNINDEQIKEILRTNGYIGIAFVKDFYNKKNIFDIDYLAKCICEICIKYGTDNFGIGSDFWGTKNLPIGLKNYDQFTKLKNKLNDYGMKNKEIDKLFYYNFYNFLIRTQKLDNKT